MELGIGLLTRKASPKLGCRSVLAYRRGDRWRDAGTWLRDPSGGAARAAAATSTLRSTRPWGRSWRRKGLHTHAIPKAVLKNADDSLTLQLEDGRHLTVDCLIWGHRPRPGYRQLNLAATGITWTRRASSRTDKFQNTAVANLYAVGDNTGRIQLTLVAVAAGRRLSERLFNNKPNEHLNYDLVPTVVFQPPAHRHHRA